MFALSRFHRVALSLFLGFGICWLFVLLLSQSQQVEAVNAMMPTVSGLDTAVSPQVTAVISTLNILVDDFEPQPIQGDPTYFYNRLGGDRGALSNLPEDVELDYGTGRVTATINSGTWGGMWIGLNHLEREDMPINFSAILPNAISATHQVQITGLTIEVVDSNITSGSGHLKLELKNGGNVNWVATSTLTGGPQTIAFSLPPMTDMTTLIWLLNQVNPNDFIVIDRITLTATSPITDVAEQAFTWSYGMLLNNWDTNTGLTRDRANFPSGVFDAVQATGSLAASTAVARQLGIVSQQDAISIVNKISDTLLLDVPRYKGIWPHFVEITPTNNITIAENTEWSSVDTVIAALGLLEAQTALGLDTSGTISMLQDIDWAALVLPTGISHGYGYDKTLLTSTWDTFGGESWLMGWIYAAATGEIAPLAYPDTPTANGSGFIDELAWLFAPPPCGRDVWDAHWPPYLRQAILKQINFFPTEEPDSCFAQLGLFGLSAAEAPDPSAVIPSNIYQPFGVGGQFTPPVTGTTLLGAPVVAPHYSAMVALYRPQESRAMWSWLIDNDLFTPLNNVESLMFPADAVSCSADEVVWNELKGSWNLALQTLGWGRYLAREQGEAPILWQAMQDNDFLANGYDLVAHQCVYLPYIGR